jgi:hypothetical protein
MNEHTVFPSDVGPAHQSHYIQFFVELLTLGNHHINGLKGLKDVYLETPGRPA